MATRYYDDEQVHVQMGFSADDLEENRAGRLSEVQKHKITHEANRLRALFWIIFALMAGLVIAALIEFRSLLENQALVWIALLLGSGFIGLLAFMLWQASDQQTRAEIRAGVVDRVEGTVVVFNGGSEAEPIYTVTIGHHTIEDVPEPVYKAFENGRRYRVYFLRKRILSAERVD